MVDLPYRDWKSIGFQVKGGERASGTNSSGDPTFSEAQVGRIIGWDKIPYIPEKGMIQGTPAWMNARVASETEGSNEIDDFYDFGGYDGN